MMTHDQEIESHPFFKKHFAGKSIKEYHEIPHDGGSAGYHQWTAHHGIGLTPVKHKLFHRYHPETNSHFVLLTTGTEGRNILGNHTYHFGEGEGSSATKAFEKAIHAYKNDHGFHLQESMDQFASNKREINMKDFRDFVKTTYDGLMEVEGLCEYTLEEAKNIDVNDITTHPFFKKHFAGTDSWPSISSSSRQMYEIQDEEQPHVSHRITHIRPDRNHIGHAVEIETQHYGRTKHVGGGRGTTAHEAMDNAIHTYTHPVKVKPLTESLAGNKIYRS